MSNNPFAGKNPFGGNNGSNNPFSGGDGKIAEEQKTDLRNVLDGLHLASKEVVSFCTEFYILADDNGYQYMKEGLVKRLPSELGMTDLFMFTLAHECGKQAHRTLINMNFAGDESKTGYDFMVQFNVNKRIHTFYLQAKCIQYKENLGHYVKFLAKTQATSGSHQWELLRDHTAKEMAATTNFNRNGNTVMGMYILYSKEGCYYIPIGRLQALSEHFPSTVMDNNMGIWFIGGTSAHGENKIFEAFSKDLNRDYSNVDMFCYDDVDMQNYALQQRALGKI